MENNEAFLRKVFLEARSLGNVPVVICGDFNVKLENSAVLTEQSSTGEWVDAAGLVSPCT